MINEELLIEVYDVREDSVWEFDVHVTHFLDIPGDYRSYDSSDDYYGTVELEYVVKGGTQGVPEDIRDQIYDNVLEAMRYEMRCHSAQYQIDMFKGDY